MTSADAVPKSRFLVLHDYGMGGTWWWVHARSPQEILETFAEVEVATDRDVIARADSWNLDEVDIDASTMPPGLDDLKTTRDSQRGLPGFAALADRDVLYLRRRWDGADDVDPAVYLMEVGPDGRRIRQVELGEDGTALKSGPDDWAFNPPVVDLFDPDLANMEIPAEEFEAAWLGAHHVDAEP